MSSVKELREKTVTELEAELIELRREQFSLRMQNGIGQSPKPHLFSEVRRNIARTKTIITEKKHESEVK